MSLVPLVPAPLEDMAVVGWIDWPDTPRALTNALERMAPNLRAIGIDFHREGREPGTGRRRVVLRRIGAGTSNVVTVVTPFTTQR